MTLCRARRGRREARGRRGGAEAAGAEGGGREDAPGEDGEGQAEGQARPGQAGAHRGRPLDEELLQLTAGANAEQNSFEWLFLQLIEYKK